MMRIAVLFLASLASVVPATARDLSPSDIRQQLVGQPLRWWANDVVSVGSLVLAPDGRATVTTENPDAEHVGTWRLVGDTLCTRWATARGGQEKCYRIEEVAPDRFATTGGNVFEIIAPGA